MKSCNLTSVYSELERLMEENRRLEKQCNDVTRQLDLIRRESNKEAEVSLQVACPPEFGVGTLMQIVPPNLKKNSAQNLPKHAI